MIKSVVRLYKFRPKDIDKLYLDDIDYHGIIYWFDDAKEYVKEIVKYG